MISSASGSETQAFPLLDSRIQRWIWDRGWTSLRSVQEAAIPVLLEGTQDVILAAATSAGKTEAAFFPILTRLMRASEDRGFVLSISPLKALINDQAERLNELCYSLELPVLGWHGDISASRKQKFLRVLRGVLIITPESLEALFVNRGTTMPAFAASVQHIVVDELHSFLDTERGKQVQSLMHRLERAAGRTLPRVGLSATLGDKSLAASFLRPGHGATVTTIDAGHEGYELRLGVKGYVDSGLDDSETPELDDSKGSLESSLQGSGESARTRIVDFLYTHLRGSNNLVFPNSRSNVEYFADQLRIRSEREGVRNEFWAHHGSLSRELREEVEGALKRSNDSATAICTTTLELGIDIGNIKSVAQIGPPPSVASLRQRVGRSGRRLGEPAILRCFCIEKELTDKSPFSDRIREGLTQTVAMVRLLMQSWVEPPRTEGIHASTFVQQVLSVIAQCGGATAEDLWKVLVSSGSFDRITREMFVEILRGLGQRKILQQESSGLLLPGELGEKFVNNYEFYSAFSTPEEFRLVAGDRVLGSLPIDRPLTEGQRVIFGGRRWRVQELDTIHKVVYVAADRGGVPPAFDGGRGQVHDRVRQEMRSVLSESEMIGYLDTNGVKLLQEARRTYRDLDLGNRNWFQDGRNKYLLTWRGDAVNNTLALMLSRRGIATTSEGVGLIVSSVVDESDLRSELHSLGTQPLPSNAQLGITPEMATVEKWDWALPDGCRVASYASAKLDPEGARVLANQLAAAL